MCLHRDPEVTMAPVLGRSHLRMQGRHKLEAGKDMKLTTTHAPDTDPMLTVLSTTGPFPGTHRARKFYNQVQQCPPGTFFFSSATTMVCMHLPTARAVKPNLVMVSRGGNSDS